MAFLMKTFQFKSVNHTGSFPIDLLTYLRQNVFKKCVLNVSQIAGYISSHRTVSGRRHKRGSDSSDRCAGAVPAGPDCGAFVPGVSIEPCEPR